MPTTSLILRFPDVLYDWMLDESERRGCTLMTILIEATDLYRQSVQGWDDASEAAYTGTAETLAGPTADIPAAPFPRVVMRDGTNVYTRKEGGLYDHY